MYIYDFYLTTLAYILVIGNESQLTSGSVCRCTDACKPFNHYIYKVLIKINLYHNENR